MSEIPSIKVAEEQMCSLMDYKRYRTFMRHLGTKKSDLNRARLTEDVLVGEALVERGDTVMGGLLREASDRLVYLTSKYFAEDHLLDTTDPETWLDVEEILTCINRLVALPGFRPKANEDGTVFGVRDRIEMGLRVCDAAFVISERTTIESGKIDSEVPRVASLYRDILCGRGVGWIDYCRGNYVLACVTRGIDFMEMRTKRGQATLGFCLRALREVRSDLNDKKSLESLQLMMLIVAQAYDTLQEAAAYEAGYANAEVPEHDEDLARCIDDDVAAEVVGSWLPEVNRVEQPQACTGYCERFNVTPIGACFLLGHEQELVLWQMALAMVEAAKK